jgi:tetratricopeptide (TPR) repeat protein
MKKITKKVMITIGIIAAGLVLGFIGNLVWGKTIRMSRANHAFTSGRTDAAQKTYANLAVDLPESPYVLHNLGLAAYQKGQYRQATDAFQKALKKAAEISSETKNVKELTTKCHYHLGGTQFALAEAEKPGANSASPQQITDLYSGALANFRRAIEADPADQDAKYNYELTKLRLDNAEQQKQHNQNQRSQDSQKQKDNNKNDQSKQSKQPDQKQTPDQKANESKGNKQQKPNQQQANRGQAEKQKRGMTKEEAQTLLNAAENGDQYMAPMIKDNSAVQKDW